MSKLSTVCRPFSLTLVTLDCSTSSFLYCFLIWDVKLYCVQILLVGIGKHALGLSSVIGGQAVEFWYWMADVLCVFAVFHCVYYCVLLCSVCIVCVWRIVCITGLNLIQPVPGSCPNSIARSQPRHQPHDTHMCIVYMCIYVCAHISKDTHTRVHACTHAWTHACVHVCVLANTHADTPQMQARTHAQCVAHPPLFIFVI